MMPEPDSVLYCGLNEITFSVDDVTPGEERFPTTSLWTRAQKLTGLPLLTASHASNFAVVEDDGTHPLLSAVHLAFSRHLPLALTPDIIWLAISQGFALHVSNHSEELRPLLVRHEGKVEVEATLWQWEHPEDWAEAVEQWAQEIESHLPPDLHNTLVCDFSTTTPIIRTASQVVMMEAFRPYCDYIAYCICGIPQITLHGTVEDWRTIRARVERLAPYQLSWWTDRLLPLCDAFIATAAGQPSLEFWQHIYKPEYAYGGERITGWIVDLFPYTLNAMHEPKIPNPLFDRERHKKNPLPPKEPDPDDQFAYLVPKDGLRSSGFPTGLSSAPATQKVGLSGHKNASLNFLGGFLGVTQNSRTGCLTPELGWGVQAGDNFSNVLETLKRDHALAPPAQEVQFDMEFHMRGVPAEIIQMLDYCDGGTLFANSEHPWQIRPYRAYTQHDILENGSCTCFLDLKDERNLGYSMVSWSEVTEDGYTIYKHEWWIVVGRKEPGPDSFEEPGGIFQPKEPGEIFRSEDLVVIAKSLSQFFERVLQADGAYYFDSPDFVPDALSLPE